MIGWAYLAGYAWFWRYHVGFLLDEITDGADNADGIDWCFGIFIASLVCLIWPVTVAGRMIQVTHRKYFDAVLPSANIFPGPKTIETKSERIKRQQAEESRRQHEQKIAISAARREINDHERANGIPLTEWTD